MSKRSKADLAQSGAGAQSPVTPADTAQSMLARIAELERRADAASETLTKMAGAVAALEAEIARARTYVSTVTGNLAQRIGAIDNWIYEYTRWPSGNVRKWR